MPMHMQLFVVQNFPVKVLGLIHLRNTIRVLHPVEPRAPLRLTVHFDTMRLTDFGQEYDFTTRYEQNGAVVWEEVSTMFARGNTAPKEGSKRPAIERANAPASGVSTETLDVRDNTGWRYARCPATSTRFISLHARRRCSASKRWRTECERSAGVSRCCQPLSWQDAVDTQFSCPSTSRRRLARARNAGETLQIAMCTMRGDRLHLAMQVRPL
jgi:hypothetical protein